MALNSCGGLTARKDEFVERWLEGVERLKAEDKERWNRTQVIMYFDARWHSVAYETLSERLLKDYNQMPVGSPSALLGWFDSVKEEARDSFYARYGLMPPDYFPPREPDDIDNIQHWNRGLIYMKWEPLIKEAGLSEPSDIPQHLERWRDYWAKLQIKEEKAKEAAARYGFKIWEGREHVELVAVLELFKGRLSSPSKPGSLPYIKAGEFPSPRWLDLLEQLQLAESRKTGADAEWRLTSKGAKRLREQKLDDLAASLLRSGLRPRE